LSATVILIKRVKADSKRDLSTTSRKPDSVSGCFTVIWIKRVKEDSKQDLSTITRKPDSVSG